MDREGCTEIMSNTYGVTVLVSLPPLLARLAGDSLS